MPFLGSDKWDYPGLEHRVRRSSLGRELAAPRILLCGPVSTEGQEWTLAAVVDRLGLRWEDHRDRVALVNRVALWIRYVRSIIRRYFPCFGEHDSYALRRST